MKKQAQLNFCILATAVILSSSVSSAADRPVGSVSASIQATARVIPSQGVELTQPDPTRSTISETDDWWLWIPKDDNLQVQLTADGLVIESRLVTGSVDKAELSLLEQHRHNGLVRCQFEVDSLPTGASECTVTIVNPTN